MKLFYCIVCVLLFFFSTTMQLMALTERSVQFLSSIGGSEIAHDPSSVDLILQSSATDVLELSQWDLVRTNSVPCQSSSVQFLVVDKNSGILLATGDMETYSSNTNAFQVLLDQMTENSMSVESLRYRHYLSTEIGDFCLVQRYFSADTSISQHPPLALRILYRNSVITLLGKVPGTYLFTCAEEILSSIHINAEYR